MMTNQDKFNFLIELAESCDQKTNIVKRVPVDKKTGEVLLSVWLQAVAMTIPVDES